MKLLLDTHTYLWAINEAELLPAAAREALDDSRNELYLSVVSLWEATIKIASGKLRVPGQAIDFFLQGLDRTEVKLVPILPTHLRELQRLHWQHRDPFDRMLVAQATVEGMRLVTVDREVRKYFEDCL